MRPCAAWRFRYHHNRAHPQLDRVGCRLLARRWPQPPSRAPLAAVGLIAAGALAGALPRVDVALPVLAATVVIALAVVAFHPYQ
jgi:hypothetical protein